MAHGKEPPLSSQNSPEPRGLLLTLIGAFSGFLLGVFVSRQRTPIQKSVNPNDPTSETNKQQQNGEEKRVHIVAVEPYPSPRPSNEEETYRARKEFCEWGILTVEVLGLCGLIFYACTTYRMWREMQEQTKTAQRQLEQSERAWMTLEITADTGIEFTKVGEMRITVKPHLKNIGKSVASGITFNAKLFLQDPDNGQIFFHEPIEQQAAICDKVASSPLISGNESDSMGRVVFPGDTNQDLGYGFVIPKAEIDKRGKQVKLKSGEGRIVFPVLVGCVDYQYATAARHHQTKFVYLLKWFDRTIPPGFVNEVAIKVGTSVSAPDVRFEKWQFGGFYTY